MFLISFPMEVVGIVKKNLEKSATFCKNLENSRKFIVTYLYTTQPKRSWLFVITQYQNVLYNTFSLL